MHVTGLTLPQSADRFEVEPESPPFVDDRFSKAFGRSHATTKHDDDEPRAADVSVPRNVGASQPSAAPRNVGASQHNATPRPSGARTAGERPNVLTAEIHDEDDLSPSSDPADVAPDADRSQSGSASPAPFVIDAPKLRALQEEHFEFLWRSLRRLGVPEADVDDAVQQVFLVAARRTIQPGAERAFLFSTALRVASHARRTLRRRREADEPVPEQTDLSPSPEELLDQRRARALLDEVLSSLPLDLRAVFILYELEELTVVEIALMLGIPGGTAASRLRRARECFHETVERVRINAKRREP